MSVQIRNNPVNSICHSKKDCVCDLVRIVDQRQKEAEISDCPDVERELGGQTPVVNTRPFILYLPNGDRFRIRISELCTADDTTTVFRVEEVRDCCALIRGLDCGPNNNLVCTNFCCWVDLRQFIGVQFFSDILVNIPCPS